MTQFPQLSRLAAVQYPSDVVRCRPRTECELPGGAVIVSSDSSPGWKTWSIQYQWLNDEERDLLETFFRERRGRLEPFRWLDPASNLLKWSTSLDQAPWTGDPGIALEDSIQDPEGGTEAWRMINGSQAAAGIRQRLPVSLSHVYTASLWVRAATETPVTLCAGPVGSTGITLRATTAWKRLGSTSLPQESQGDFEFALSTPPGACIEIFGPQLENQLAAGGYRRTFERAGVCVARFNQDHLSFTATGPGQYSTAFELTSLLEA